MRIFSVVLLAATFSLSGALSGHAEDKKPEDKKPMPLVKDWTTPVVPKGYSLDFKTEETPSVATKPPAALTNPNEAVVPYVGFSISKPLNAPGR